MPLPEKRYYTGYYDVPFADLQGLTLAQVIREDDDALYFFTNDGRKFQMLHHQDCCEGVYIESIVGDLSDLVDTPILLAEEISNAAAPADASEPKYRDECEEWTFYKLRTIKGSVDIRWYGSSNGYYSTSVDFEEFAEKNAEYERRY